jgi:hypothetical protein
MHKARALNVADSHSDIACVTLAVLMKFALDPQSLTKKSS